METIEYEHVANTHWHHNRATQAVAISWYNVVVIALGGQCVAGYWLTEHTLFAIGGLPVLGLAAIGVVLGATAGLVASLNRATRRAGLVCLAMTTCLLACSYLGLRVGETLMGINPAW